MEEQEWVDNLLEEKVDEFTLYPRAITRIEKGPEFELPDLDFDNGDDDKDEKDKKDSSGNAQNASSSTIKTITITIGGIAIGIATGVAATQALTPPPVCPAPVVQQTATTQPAKTDATGAPIVPVRSTQTTSGSATSPADGSVPR
jgi:hypothetical protein